MSASSLLAQIIPLLDASGIQHMIAGSIASTYHGEPRTTQDIDIVIFGSRAGLDAFVASLPVDKFYCDAEVAREAFTRRSQFNLIDMQTGWKIDFILRKDRPFSIAEFERRIRATILECDAFVATAEDTIVAKLDWSRESESERQLRDVASILSVSGGHLDFAYIEKWVNDLGLQGLWSRVKDA